MLKLAKIALIFAIALVAIAATRTGPLSPERAAEPSPFIADPPPEQPTYGIATTPWADDLAEWLYGGPR